MANLFLTKGLMSSKGKVENTVIGGVKVFLQKAYGSDSPLETHTVTLGDGSTAEATRVNASLKIDESMARQLKYFFDLDVPAGDFVRFQLTLWGQAGTNLRKFNPQNGDLYLFFISALRVDRFQRKDGTPGFSLAGRAFAFEPALTKKRADGEANKPAAKPAAKAASAPQQAKPAYPEQTETYSEEDFEAIAESDDLPF